MRNRFTRFPNERGARSSSREDALIRALDFQRGMQSKRGLCASHAPLVRAMEQDLQDQGIVFTTNPGPAPIVPESHCTQCAFGRKI